MRGKVLLSSNKNCFIGKLNRTDDLQTYSILIFKTIQNDNIKSMGMKVVM